MAFAIASVGVALNVRGCSAPNAAETPYPPSSSDLTLFVDKPKRETNFRHEKFETDFHLRAQLHASYFNMPDAEVNWGAGGLVEFLSVRLLEGEWLFALGGSYNYYDDIVMLALPEVFMVKMSVSAGW